MSVCTGPCVIILWRPIEARCFLPATLPDGLSKVKLGVFLSTTSRVASSTNESRQRLQAEGGES